MCSNLAPAQGTESLFGARLIVLVIVVVLLRGLPCGATSRHWGRIQGFWGMEQGGGHLHRADRRNSVSGSRETWLLPWADVGPRAVYALGADATPPGDPS